MIDMTRDEIERLLGNQQIGRLGMCGADGRPYVIPLPFCWLKGSLYLRLPLSGRKGQVLEENSRVCFEVDEYSNSMDEYASVLIEGQLIEVRDVDEKQRVREATAQKYTRLRGGYRPGHGRAIPIEQLAMRKILVETLSGKKKTPSVGANVA